VNPPNEGGPRKGCPEATTTTQSARRDSNPTSGHEVAQILAMVRRFESAARVLADDEGLSVRARCNGLLELMANARRRDGAAFFERAVWRGCRHLFEGDEQVPHDLIEANHRLIRRGHDRCPECLRSLPSHDDLRRWRKLGHVSLLGSSA
jgi:hypothetical protein